MFGDDPATDKYYLKKYLKDLEPEAPLPLGLAAILGVLFLIMAWVNN